ncbi:ABC-three component system protein [Pelistega suis]|uniref:ABC-three component systems C-terminal domain-containing protein n=1 Tax=Pelistega suis TaxID=1631957 RepID=A0A849PA63_9BURK|nr:ABC-three component system protein [Pelistega suis]NOL51807.1 hypothetical protein [Pelistega suis]
MYHYEDIEAPQFEKLVIAICQHILGEGVQGFTAGRDGGKDGVFVGKANSYPSLQTPWEGTIVIQAKHTYGINKHFLETDFYGNNSCVLSKEAEKIKKLISNNQLTHYMLFANRKLTGDASSKVRNFISQKTNLSEQNIAILGIDDLDNWLNRYPDIPQRRDINLQPLNIAPLIDPNNLAKVISCFSHVFATETKTMDRYVANSIQRTTFSEKNNLNEMPENFGKELVKLYMPLIPNIDNFLHDPQNRLILENYQEAVEEFQLKYILKKRTEGLSFDKIFNNLVDYLTNRDFTLKQNKRLTRAMVFYMYWSCDIGISESNATSE